MEYKRTFQHSRYWLILAAFSLGLACLLAVVLVFSRLPGVAQYFVELSTFHTALVLHVNLSLFVWLFSFTALIWNYAYTLPYPMLSKLSLFLCVFGVLLMLTIPIIGEAPPILNNYLPVLNHPGYFGALFFFISGFLILIIQVLLAPIQDQAIKNLCPCCLKIIAISFVMAILTTLIVFLRLPDSIPVHNFYEQLFWASGHQMQIIYTLIMLWSWLWLSKQAGIILPFSAKTIRNWFVIGVSPIILSLFIPLYVPPTSGEFKTIFTNLMIYSSWLALPYLGGKLLISILLQKPTILTSIIILSMALFLFGLFIGTQITHNNLMIPAHYHALTGAINIVLMLVAYQLILKMGFIPPTSIVQVKQIGIYAIGIVFLASGLAWSGQLGMARKMMLSYHENYEQLFALGMMGLGGLLSLLGCFLFLGILFQYMGIWPKKTFLAKPLAILNKGQ